MIENKDRVAQYPGRFVVSPENGKAFYATLTRADAPLVEGAPLNKAKMDELLAATGTTTGTAAALKLAQAGFVLKDGATIRFKLHTAVNADTVTLNVAGTGAKPLKGLDGEYINAAAGAELQAVYNGSAWMCTAIGAKAVGQLKGPDGALVKPGYVIRAIQDPLMAAPYQPSSVAWASNSGYFIYSDYDRNSKSSKYYVMDFNSQVIDPLTFSIIEPEYYDNIIFLFQDYLCVYHAKDTTLGLYRFFHDSGGSLMIELVNKSIALPANTRLPKFAFIRNGIFYMTAEIDQDRFYNPYCMIKLTKTGACTTTEFNARASVCVGSYGDNYYFDCVRWGGNPNEFSCYNAALNTMTEQSNSMFSPKGEFPSGGVSYDKYSFVASWWSGEYTLYRYDYENRQITTMNLTSYGDKTNQDSAGVLGVYSVERDLIVVCCNPYIVFLDPTTMSIMRTISIDQTTAKAFEYAARSADLSEERVTSSSCIFGGRYVCITCAGATRIFDLKVARPIANLGVNLTAARFTSRRHGQILQAPFFITGPSGSDFVQAFRIAQVPFIPWNP